MPRLGMTAGQYAFREGMTVFDADGENLGVIAAVVHPADEAPDARGGRVFLVEPGPVGAGPGWEDLCIAAAPLGGLLVRPEAFLGRSGGRGALYVPEAAIAGVDDEGVTLDCTGAEVEDAGRAAGPAGLGGPTRA